MPNELAKKGAAPSKPVRYAAMWNEYFYNGIITQRNPLRGAASHIENEFYGSRMDTLIDGENCEVSSKLTLIRRPGHTVYNSGNFPAITRFYENRTNVYNGSQTAANEKIQVVADVVTTSVGPETLNITTIQVTSRQVTFLPPFYEYTTTVTFSTIPPPVVSGETYAFSGITNYTSLNGQTLSPNSVSGDSVSFFTGGGTFSSTYGPAADTGSAFVTSSLPLVGGTVRDVTGPSTNNILFQKSPGAGSTYFQSVGNALYFSDGPDQKKLITPNLVWSPNQLFNDGNQIIDTNGNLQLVQGTGTATITEIQVIDSDLGIPGRDNYFIQVTFSSDVYWTQNTPVSFSGVTTYTSLNGQTLNAQVNNAYLTPYENVAYFPSAIQTLYGPASDTGTGTSTTNTGGGTSGATQPTWSTALGGLTTDNQLTWQNFGLPIYDWATASPVTGPTLNPVANNRQWTANTEFTAYYSILDTNNNVEVLTAGTPPLRSGTIVPIWSTIVPNLSAGTIGGQTSDGQVIWQNCGPILSWAPSTSYQLYQCILDSNQNLQIVTNGAGGASGATQPTWMTTVGVGTTDGALTWTCVGPGSTILTGSVNYAYSWVSIDGSVTTASPLTVQSVGSYVLGPVGNARALLSGVFPTDPQIAFAWLWRTVQGGSTLFFDAAIPNPTPGTASAWSFTDVVPDTSLNELIEAPIDDQNDPPTLGVVPLAYHLGCIWGALGNNLYYSDGPLVTAGNGNTAWSPSNVFVFPSTVVVAWPTSVGLLVFTSSDIYIIQGTNTASSPLFATPFLQNIGILSYDAFAVNGSIAHLYTSDNQVITLDPSSGVSETGFPIGDQFGPDYGTETFTPTSTHVTWHIAQSQDKGLYVSDFTGTWWRMCPTPSPESGTTWSPKASIIGGFSAVQSVETSPGIHNLLLGPQSSGPILQRNYKVYSDNGSSYHAFAVLGSLVLAQPGQLAAVEMLTTDSVAVGTPISLAIQLDEIGPVSAGLFETLSDYVPDPTELEPSITTYAQRFYVSQTQLPALCRHLQILIDWGTDQVKNELLSLSLFGGFDQEK